MNHLFGQFHPVFVHLPIGILVIAVLFKLLSRSNDGSRYEKVIPVLVGCAFIASLASALTGYLLSRTGGYEEDLLSNHKWSGFGLTFLTGLLYFSISKNLSPRVQQIAWLANVLGLFITGHLGGQLTHGEDYLSFNFKSYHKPVIKNMDSALVYHDLIEPILAGKCWSCHSSVKQKGLLRLDGLDHILKGGKHGDIVSSQPDQSKMYHRLTLPRSADDHMPPSGQIQPTTDEIKLIGWWLQNDATQDKLVLHSNATPEIKSILAEMIEDENAVTSTLLPPEDIGPADQKILSSLNKAGITAIPIAQNSNYLNVILHASSFKSSSWILLKDISKNITWLSAKNIRMDDTAMNAIVQFDHLIKLDLSQSTVNDTTAGKLSSLTLLRTLNLNSTGVTEKGLTALDHLNSLESIYIYHSKVNPNAWIQLKNTFPKVTIDTGNYRVPVFASDTTEYTYDQLAKDKKARGLPVVPAK